MLREGGVLIILIKKVPMGKNDMDCGAQVLSHNYNTHWNTC